MQVNQVMGGKARRGVKTVRRVVVPHPLCPVLDAQKSCPGIASHVAGWGPPGDKESPFHRGAHDEAFPA